MNTPTIPTWYSKATSSGQGLIIDETTSENIAVVYDAKNTPLLEAAPDLLAALDVLESALEMHGAIPRNFNARIAARAAIAKATQP